MAITTVREVISQISIRIESEVIVICREIEEKIASVVTRPTERCKTGTFLEITTYRWSDLSIKKVAEKYRESGWLVELDVEANGCISCLKLSLPSKVKEKI